MIEPPPEPASEEMIVDGHPLDRQRGHLGHGLARAIGHLRSDPNVATVFANVDRAVHRLHCRVSQDRHAIRRLDAFGVRGLRRGNITAGVRDNCIAGRRRIDATFELVRGQRSIGAAIPVDVERREPLSRGAGVVRHHGHGVRQLDDLSNPFDLERRTVFDGRKSPAKGRTDRNRRELQARRPRVDPEQCGAVDLGWGVDAPRSLSDQLELARRLQRHVLRDRQHGCLRSERPISKAPSGRAVNHDARRRATGCRQNTPFLRRRGDQHDTRRRTCLEHRLIEATDGDRTTGDLITKDGMSIATGVRRCRHGNDLVEGHFQFFRE